MMKFAAVILIAFVFNLSSITAGGDEDKSFWDWTNQVLDGPEKVRQKVTMVFTWALEI